MSVHRKRERRCAAMMRETTQHLSQFGAREAAATELGRHAEFEEAVRAERRHVRSNVFACEIAVAALGGQLRAKFVENAFPIRCGGARRFGDLNIHNTT